jgi:hypothetical protein
MKEEFDASVKEALESHKFLLPSLAFPRYEFSDNLTLIRERPCQRRS